MCLHHFTTADRRPGCREWFLVADTAFALASAWPSEGCTGSAEAIAAATAAAQNSPSPTSNSQGADSAVIIDPAASTPSPPGDPAPPIALPPSGRTSTRRRRRTADATGAAPPAVDHGLGPGRALSPSARRANTPPRVPRPRSPLAVVTAHLFLPPRLPRPLPSRPATTAPSLWKVPLYDPPVYIPSATTVDWDALGDDAELQLENSAVRYSHAGYARE